MLDERLSYHPNVIIYTLVLRTYEQTGKIKLSEDTFFEMLEAGCEPDEVACGTMLCTYAKWGRHEPMLSFYYVVQQRGIMLTVAVYNGKKLMVVRIVKHSMEIIHLLTDANPIQIIVDVVINSGLREDTTRIGSTGVVSRQAVDISPLRCVNQAIYLLTIGARENAFRNVKIIAECLADDELSMRPRVLLTAMQSRKKNEIKRVAKANR